MKVAVEFIKYIFFLVIDVCGAIFGATLFYIGWRLQGDRPLSLETSGWIVLVLGCLSFSIHGTHYIYARLHGSNYFRTTRKEG